MSPTISGYTSALNRLGKNLAGAGAFPFVILMMVMVVLLTLFPDLALWLPAKMM